MATTKKKPSIKATIPVTHQIVDTAFALLEKNKAGLQWSELITKIKAADPTFHPKTVNGCIWKLVERYPDKVYKPAKGLFRLVKYKSPKTAARK